MRTVTITLTLAEAKALSHVAGNTTSDPYAMDAIFRTKTDIKSAYRAHQKLDDALRAAAAYSTRR
jgi:hypothetical protein